MYKLIIADDEKINRDGLRDLFDWNELGFEIVGVFSDGLQIVEYLEDMSVDVIFTDIKMGTISGIEVAKYVSENCSNIKVIFISGLKEFDLALQGIKYGVDDYLLKPINVETVKETFQKIKAFFDEKKEKNELVQIEKDRFSEAFSILKEQFFGNLILGVVDDSEYIKSRMAILYPGIDPLKSHCVLMDITIIDYEQFMEAWQYSYDQFEANIVQFIDLYDKQLSFHMVYKSGEHIEVFGILDNDTINAESAEKIIRDEFMKFIDDLTTLFKLKTEYKIKKIFTNLYEVINYKETILDQRYQEKKDMTHILEQKKLITSHISGGSILTAQKIFHNILEESRNLNQIYRNNLLIEIFFSINELIKNNNSELSEQLQPYFDYSKIVGLSNFEETKKYCNRIFDKLRSISGKLAPNGVGSLINMAKQYITDNITSDIGREETANRLHISSTYLSKIFTSQIGESFLQHVTRIKMDKAVELLRDPRYKIYQVSEYLGYKTPRYFAKLFRNQTGLNPSEYRSKVLNIGGEADDEAEI